MERIFQERPLVRAAECDFRGRMRLSALFLAMQEGAEKSAESLGAGRRALWEKNLFFALSRIRVEVSRLPELGEIVVHETWPGVPNRFFYPRYHIFRLEDGTKLAAAASLWVTMDRNARSIVPPAAAGLVFPDTSGIQPPCPLPGKPKEPAMDAAASETVPQYEDLDLNGHVNNARYIGWLCNALGTDAFETGFIRTLIAGYEKEIRSGQRIKHKVYSEGGAFAYRVEDETGSRCFSASGEMGMEHE